MTMSRTNSLAVKWRSTWGVRASEARTPVGSVDHQILAAGAAGVALEPVVEIVMLAAPPGPEAGRQISGDEGPAPALDLPDMGLLVVAAGVEAVGVPADDHVAQRHRGEPAFPPEPAREAAVELERPPAILDRATGGEGQRPRRQAHAGRGAAQA